MNKKLVISKTVLFLFIILFILGFQKIFGIENTLIGVTVITAALMLLERDFTISPIKYLLYIMGINVFLGISAFIASENLWVGIPVNFITVFIIGFLFCYDLKSNMYIPFGLQYLFMLSVPVEVKNLGIRLLSLVVGSIFIIIMQMICNKNKLVKSGNKIIENASKNLLKKIHLLMEEKEVVNLDKCFKKDIGELKKLIYSKRKDSFYLTEGGRIKLNIGATLEGINSTISDLYEEFNKDDITKILNYVYNELNKISQSKKDVDLLKSIRNEVTKLSPFQNEESNIHIMKIENNLEILCNCFMKLNNLEEHNFVNKTSSIPSEFNFVNITKRNFTTSTLRFSYAFRVALCVTISIFIMDYFKVYEGRWMAYTVFSLIQPYSEHSKIKSRQRVKGTLIGGIVFIILFSIIKDTTMRSLIVMGAGYIDGYNTRYDRKIICVTISALGVAAITSSIGLELSYRILFVGLGVALSLLANKFIFPYSLNDANRDLIKMSNSTMKEFIKEVKLYIIEKNNSHSIENLFIIFSIIENKLILNKSKAYEDFLENKKKIVNNIYQIYVWSENRKISDEDFKNFTIKYKALVD